MDKEDKTKEAAKMLLEGAKMLAISCPQCHDPILQKKTGEMYCVNCASIIVYEMDTPEKIQPRNSESDPIQTKIQKLSTLLDSETDPEKIVELAELIKKLQKINQN